MKYIPGLITGGGGIIHDCPVTRSVGYFLEPLAMLAPFGKKPLAITLKVCPTIHHIHIHIRMQLSSSFIVCTHRVSPMTTKISRCVVQQCPPIQSVHYHSHVLMMYPFVPTG
jgi:hypothetical protein